MLEEKRKQDSRGNKQQCLLILRQPGNGADGDKERRKERQRKGREGRRRDKTLCDLLLTVSPHLVTFYGLTNNTIILNITMDKPTDEPRDPRFHFPPPPCLDSAIGRTPEPTWGLLLLQPEDQIHPQEHYQVNLLQMPCLLRNFYIWCGGGKNHVDPRA